MSSSASSACRLGGIPHDGSEGAEAREHADERAGALWTRYYRILFVDVRKRRHHEHLVPRAVWLEDDPPQVRAHQDKPDRAVLRAVRRLEDKLDRAGLHAVRRTPAAA